MEELIHALLNSGPVGLLATAAILGNLFLVAWLRSVYKTLGEIQERRVMERDAVVTALKSAADGLDDVARMTPELIELLRVIKEMICPDPLPRKRR